MFKMTNIYLDALYPMSGTKIILAVFIKEIFLNHNNNMLSGIDHIFKKSDGIPIRYVFRFHLNPKLIAIKTMSGSSALIQISKNKSLIFTIKDENIKIEKVYILEVKRY